MSISSITSVPSPAQALSAARDGINRSPGASGPEFTERIQNAVNDLNAAQSTAKASATDFELGRETDLAKVMIDQQVASLSMQLTLNVRNKALSAYRDIMNMPV